MLNELQIERWQQLWREASADAPWIERMRECDAKRRTVLGQILDLMNQYLGGEIGTEELRATYDKKTRTEWDVFSLGGLSGAMFLNKLVKHVPDQSLLAEKLRSALRLPSDTERGKASMGRFVNFLDIVISSGAVKRIQLQPARAAFFLSSWWHLQNTELWPISYDSGKKALVLEGLYSPGQDTVKDYFSFRDCFLALSSALSLSSWDLEHLLYGTPIEEKTDSSRDKAQPDDPDEFAGPGDVKEEEDAAISHSQIQWLLAKIGQKVGCNIWIAATDQNREWNGERLGNLSIKALPSLGMDTASQGIIRRIDVIWLKGNNQVVAAFEIEHTTSIYSGLLRMSDLMALSPSLNFPLYIVAPEGRLQQVRKELSRPTFQFLELHRRCGFFSDEDLVKESEGIMRWANAPSAIDRLASKVGDWNGEGEID